ncbi:Protein CHLOROPLAST IMPORT APPARATUS 2 [Zea mays]|uniref:Protein CHLOROPLAST IMPORT APPARATUS 2 n=1 Tax=Zea mays TaxID=4577 RepID=A0A1D6GUX6_MAIZE|nr:Protein CHLOROPLAST IMPORT APPARATUS 2 [Zea mays]
MHSPPLQQAESVLPASGQGEVCQQGLFPPATASVREGELEKDGSCSKAHFWGSLGEAAELLRFHLCGGTVRQM